MNRFEFPFDRTKRCALLVLASTLTLMMTTVATAQPPTARQKCEAAKLRHAATFAGCQIAAQARFVIKADADKLDAAMSKCRQKATKAFSNAESKFSPFCPTSGDADQIQAEIIEDAFRIGVEVSGLPVPSDACLTATGQMECHDKSGTAIPCAGTGHDGDIRAGRTPHFTDNGDGTITDNNTGLMWEKKSDDDSIHDKDLVYPWEDGPSHATALNAIAFAGYSDWRVPNVRELETIGDYGTMDLPSVPSQFDIDCGSECTVEFCSCTRSADTALHWTSNAPYHPTLPQLPGFSISFFGGGIVVGNMAKSTPLALRAVRGGL